MSNKSYGAFLKVTCCTSCDWHQSPEVLAIPRTICPKCGGIIREAVGRYIIEEQSTGIFGKREVVVGFEKKSDVSNNGWQKAWKLKPPENGTYIVSDGKIIWIDSYFISDNHWNNETHEKIVSYWKCLPELPEIDNERID